MSGAEDRRLRVGAVSYLNTRPLVYGLAETAPQIELLFDLPSRLADGLSAGRYDVALIPVIEFLREPRYSVVSDACIACRGPVLSVKLLSRKPIAQIETLALDEGSRTSAALVQILLERRFGIRPRLWPLSITADVASNSADAILLIGDRAIHPPAGPYAEVWDLGDEWCRWAEKPMVFALWAGRPGVDLRGLDVVLAEARDRGLANLESIAKTESATVAMTPRECLGYLRDNLYFHLGPRELSGLQLFREEAARLGFVPREEDMLIS
jgi:chorismate dehydratase